MQHGRIEVKLRRRATRATGRRDRGSRLEPGGRRGVCSSARDTSSGGVGHRRTKPKPAWLAGFGLPGNDSAKGPVSRILSCAVIPLGAALPQALTSDLPGGFGEKLEPPCRIGPMRDAALARGRHLPPYLVLLRVGFTLPPALPPERCALTAPFHPYPGTGRDRQQSSGGPARDRPS